MENARLDEAQAGIKIARRNINNPRYADDTTLMAKSEEELKSFLMKVKEKSEKAGLKLSIQKTKIMANRLGSNRNSERIYFGGLQITADSNCSHGIKRRLFLERKAMTNLSSILKSRDIMYGCESWTIKKAELRRTDAFDPVVLEKT